MPHRIREADVGDAEAIARLMTELGYPTTTAAMIERLQSILGDPDYSTIVADDGSAVVGVAGAGLGRYYEKDGTYARLLVLTVSARSRGRGIGGQLVAAIERWSMDHGARELVVSTGFHRREAHRFYERRGYARTGLRFVKEVGGRAKS